LFRLNFNTGRNPLPGHANKDSILWDTDNPEAGVVHQLLDTLGSLAGHYSREKSMFVIFAYARSSKCRDPTQR